jgi:hypothetical protein
MQTDYRRKQRDKTSSMRKAKEMFQVNTSVIAGKIRRRTTGFPARATGIFTRHSQNRRKSSLVRISPHVRDTKTHALPDETIYI